MIGNERKELFDKIDVGVRKGITRAIEKYKKATFNQKQGTKNIKFNGDEQDDLKKELWLYGMGIRDLQELQKIYDKIKDIDLYEISNAPNIYPDTFYFITLYGRIFSKNDYLGKINTDKSLTNLTNEEKKLHDSLMDMRNQVYNHNDPQHNNALISYDEKQSCLEITFSSVSLNLFGFSKEIILSLLDKLKISFKEETNSILRKLYNLGWDQKINKEQSLLMMYDGKFIEKYINRNSDNDTI